MWWFSRYSRPPSRAAAVRSREHVQHQGSALPWGVRAELAGWYLRRDDNPDPGKPPCYCFRGECLPPHVGAHFARRSKSANCHAAVCPSMRHSVSSTTAPDSKSRASNTLASPPSSNSSPTGTASASCGNRSRTQFASAGRLTPLRQQTRRAHPTPQRRLARRKAAPHPQI